MEKKKEMNELIDEVAENPEIAYRPKPTFKSVSLDEKEMLRKRILRRIQPLSQYLYNVGLRKFFVAGGALNVSAPKDIDIFFKDEKMFPTIPPEDIVNETRSAITVNQEGCIVQFCRYYEPSLKDLVSSFDFSHIKQGATIVLDQGGATFGWSILVEIHEIFVHPDRYQAGVIGSGFYTGGDYPLSSLFRLFKYWKRDQITDEYRTWSLIQILIRIVDRGFVDYEDFLDQLEAMDLHILPEEWELVGHDVFKDLYELLKKTR